MKELEIKSVNIKPGQAIEDVLDKLPMHKVDVVNWDLYAYLPEVSFVMAYDETHIYMKFFVKEQHAYAVTDFNNGPVWEDSCCEFFCAFDDDGYYNLETNCIGAQLLGWQGSNGEKVRGDEKIMQLLKKYPSLGYTAPLSLEGTVDWQLILTIPVDVFFRHEGLKFFPGMEFRANFYKCGDKTKVPHFVSWNPIQWPEPNFHLPAFFGKVRMV